MNGEILNEIPPPTAEATHGHTSRFVSILEMLSLFRTTTTFGVDVSPETVVRLRLFHFSHKLHASVNIVENVTQSLWSAKFKSNQIDMTRVWFVI